MSELYEYAFCQHCGRRTMHEDFICSECGHCRLSKKRGTHDTEENKRAESKAELQDRTRED
jgi:ribosomal protein L37E